MKKIHLTNEEMADFFAELYILRQAQIPEKEALQMMTEDQDKKAMLMFLTTLSKAPSLISGLEQFPTVIPEYIIALLRQAIRNNTEFKALEDIAEHLSNASLTHNGTSYRQQIKSSFLYPAIVLFFLLLFSSVMLIFVVPVFDDMFKSFGKELPAFTQLFVSMSALLQNNWWVVVVSVVVVLQVWRVAHLRSAKFRRFMGLIILKIPIINTLIRTLESASVIKALSLLYSYQFSLAEALRLSATASQNTVFILALTESADKIVKGSGLVDSLKESQVFSAKTLRLLMAFERTQQLQILNKLTQSYNKQIPRGIGASLRVLNVILLMACWFIVGTMVIAMYLPIFAMGEAVG